MLVFLLIYAIILDVAEILFSLHAFDIAFILFLSTEDMNRVD